MRSNLLRGWALSSLLLAGTWVSVAQEQPASRPDDVRPATAATPRGTATPTAGGSDAAPTDAEKIARLLRSIDDLTRQVNELTAKLDDPASEFNQAETAFAELDRRLQETKKTLDSLGDDEQAGRVELEATLRELEPKHKLAKDRFDLGIRERKTFQEQIATLQKKIVQDSDALKKLKGEKPPLATQAAVETPPATPPQGPPPATVTPAPGTTDVRSTPMPGAPEVQSPPGAASPEAPKPLLSPSKPAPELIEARQEASRKQVEARDAQAEVASLKERMDALRKSIELEQQQLQISRQKAQNAQETERSLYEALQKKWAGGATPDELTELRGQIAEARERLQQSETEARERTDRLSKYQSELTALQSEHIGAIEEAQRRDAEASAAQKRVEHLESPLSPRNLWRWLLERGPKVGGIILAMVLLLWFSRFGGGRVIRLMVGRGGAGTADDRENRARTLVGVVQSAATVAIYAGGTLMILAEMGMNIVPLMGGAAVVGLAVAFGAQNLVRDYFNGFMILLENQYMINDVVKLGDVAGQVERITMRVTVLRSLDGTAHFIPNGSITRVSNLSHEWSRALFEIPVAYKEDLDLVMRELLELAKALRRDPEFRGHMIEMPEMLGVDEFADSAIIIKFVIKTKPLKQFVVKRELLRRIKRRFDELGIEIPFPQRTVYHRYENGGDAPPAGTKRLEAEAHT